ncbi:MAG: FAD-dependent oxidoreductase [Chloroflexota bacterium]
MSEKLLERETVSIAAGTANGASKSASSCCGPSTTGQSTVGLSDIGLSEATGTANGASESTSACCGPSSAIGPLPTQTTINLDTAVPCCPQPSDPSESCCTPDSLLKTLQATTEVLAQVSTPIRPAKATAKRVDLPIAIIGGGPIGLAAAAHLHERGESFVLYEAGASVGESILSWGHVKLFSPWAYNVDAASVKLLEANGWQMPDPEVLPTGQELVEDYLQPLANVPELKPHIKLNSKVTFVGRKGLDKMKTADRDDRPFVLHIEHQVEGDGDSEQTWVERVEAGAIIDASGTWSNPNPLGSGGVMAIGEDAVKNHILYGIPDVLGRHRTRYAGKHVLVVGSGHSAMNALLELKLLKDEEPETQITWAIRKEHLHTIFGGGADDALAARGELGSLTKSLVDNGTVTLLTPFFIHEIEQDGETLNVVGSLGEEDKTVTAVDEIITSTGARPDFSFLREVRVQGDAALESVPELAQLIDPNIHSCGTVRPHGEKELRQQEKDFYVIGMKSYGRAPTFLLATGYEQARSVVAGLVGDWEAAERVELNLPETGVCNSSIPLYDQVAPGGTCC